jgi:hypothetical protein
MARKFQNLETQRLYDRSHKNGEENDEENGKEEEGEGAGSDSGDSAASVIDEHGTATHTHIHGPAKTGDKTHTVHSFHEDGHHHVSKGHKTAQAAHAHSMHMHTGEAQPFGGEETPEEENAEQAPMPSGGGGSAIPGM